MSDDEPLLHELDAEERRDRIRSRSILAVAAVIACAVAFWVGSLIDTEQEQSTKAQKQTQQAQVEKFNLAQQIAAACADPSAKTLDKAAYTRLCTDARTIVREGPRGAQGVPGEQGIQGIPGIQGAAGVPGAQGIQGVPGKDGRDGSDGKPGVNGKDGQPGAVGPTGPPGADGKDGKDGATGPMGPAGADGKDGQDGAVGPMGPPGEDGANGLTPTQMTCSRADPLTKEWDCQVTAWK